MAEGGFVKISRMLKNWEHYGDAEMLKLFIHLLLSAAYKGYWDRDVYVGRGQLLTSTRGLAQELGFTHQHTRTLISTLKSTQEITQQSTHRGTLITIVKWDFYQGGIAESNTPYNTESNTESNTLTPKNQHTHYIKKDIKEIKEYKELFFSAETRTKTKNVIDELNRLTGKHFSANAEGTLKLVDKLIKDGYTEADMLAVVTKACECWAGTEYAKYLNPTNLLGQRFDGFANGGIFRPAAGAQKQTAAHSYDAREGVDYSNVFTRLDELEEAET